MLASIHPLGERARGNRWGLTAVAYVLGSVAGGAALGSLLGYVGQVVGMAAPATPTAVGLLLAVTCAVALLFDLSLGDRRLPTVHRQVNEDWLRRYRGWVYGVGFGFQLGVGVVTIVITATVHATFVLAALSQSALGGLVVGATFGLTRAVPIALVGRVGEARTLQSFHRRFQAAESSAHRLTVLVAGAAVLMGVAVAVAGTRGSWLS